jgi:Calcineurin-like phosphoesterase
MPDPDKIIATVHRAAELFRSTPGRAGGVVALAPGIADDVLVVGDLHGNVPAFRLLLETADLSHTPKRHLVLQELIHGPRLYPGENGGDRSHQLLDLVCALKCQFPDRVHLILGNHELSELTGRPIAKNGTALNALFRLGLNTAYGARSREVYAAYLELFAALPLAVRTSNRVFACHTIPDAMKRHGTVYNLTWGRDTSAETVDRFAAMVDADWFITGHQPCEEGFRMANHRQIIVDGTDPYPAYCLFPADDLVTVESLLEGVRILPVNRA